MTLKEIADTLISANRNGAEAQLLTDHYAEDAVSVEAADYTGQGRETVGLDGIRGKHAWWNSMFETMSSTVEGPFLHGDDRFAVIFEVEAVERESGKSMPMREVAVYHVADGKIVREEFFGTE